MDFIDEAIEKQRVRLGAGKAKQQTETEEAEKRDREIRAQVDQFISKIVLPFISNAKNRFEQSGLKAEVDIETSMSLDTEKIYSKGAKLLLNKGFDRKAGVVIGPSLSFSASPPYSTTIAIMAYGVDNNAIFSERLEITEMTEKLVKGYIKVFVEEVIK